MQIENIEISKLKPYEKNAKKHPKEQVQAIAASIREFGFRQPVVVFENLAGELEIVIGHGRVEAAKSLKLKSVPCVRVDDLTDQQVKALRLADNKTNESEWDFELLALELDDIIDLDMTEFGFDNLEKEEPEAGTSEASTKEVDVPVQIKARCKAGDIWVLGNHRLICGDSTDAKTIARLMNGQKADLVFTDPPYGMKKESEGVMNDNLNENDLLSFNKKWFKVAFDALKDTGCLYIWGIDEPLMDIYAEILKPLKKKNELVIRNYITWAKHSAYGVNWTGNLSYPKETEKCWFVMKGMDWNNNNAEFFNTKFERILEYMQAEAEKAGLTPRKLQEVTGVQMYSHWFTRSQFAIISEKHYTELQQAYAGCFTKPYPELRKMLGDSNNPTAELKPYFNAVGDVVDGIGLTDVWRFAQTSQKERQEGGVDHATPKPIALCGRGIKASSREGEIVLDLFGGSGSTMIAAEQLNRRCYMCELDPHYCDTILQRWEIYTGLQAVKEEEAEAM